MGDGLGDWFRRTPESLAMLEEERKALAESEDAYAAASPAEGTGACCMAGTPLAGPGVTHEVGCTRPAPVVTPSAED